MTINTNETMIPLTDENHRTIEQVREEIRFAQELAIEAGSEKGSHQKNIKLLKLEGPPTPEEIPDEKSYVDMTANILNLDRTKMTPEAFAEAILPIKLLETRMDEIRSGRHTLIMNSRSMDIVQLIVMPFKSNVAPFYTPEQIEAGVHLKELVRQSTGNQITVAGPIGAPSYLGHVIPLSSSFQLEEYFSVNIRNPKKREDQLEKVTQQYEAAFMKLRERLKAYTGPKDGPKAKTQLKLVA